jgi:hypothetical protein
MEEGKKLTTRQRKSQAPLPPDPSLYRCEVNLGRPLKERLEELQRDLQEQSGKRVTMSKLISSILEQFLDKEG